MPVEIDLIVQQSLVPARDGTVSLTRRKRDAAAGNFASAAIPPYRLAAKSDGRMTNAGRVVVLSLSFRVF